MPPHAQLRALLATLALVALLALAHLGDRLMKKLPLLLALAAAAALGGCGTLGQHGSADLLKQIDANFANCDRHITFQAGLGVVTPGAQVSGSIDCKPGAAAAAPAAPIAGASPPP